MRYFCDDKSRLFAMLFLVPICISLMLPASAFHTEREPVYRIDAEKPYLYGSRYQCQLVCRDPEDGTYQEWFYWNAPEMINLCCVGETESRAVAVYNMDGVVAFAGEGSGYRIVNPEEAEWFGLDEGGRLRAVIMNSFPYRSVEEIEKAANSCLGEGSVRSLSQGEVLTATQQAIWMIGNGERFYVDRNYVSIRGTAHYDLSEFVWPESITECRESEYTWQNIENVYRYLLALEPMEPLAPVVTQKTVQNLKCHARLRDDGTYTVTVGYDLYTGVSETDDLTVTVSCGGQLHQEKYRQGSRECIFTGITDLPPVTVTVSGYDVCGDVYLFVSDDGLSAPLIGYDRGSVPVFVQQGTEAMEESVEASEPEPDEIGPTNGVQNEDPADAGQAFRVKAGIGLLFQVIGGGFIMAAGMMTVIGMLKIFRLRHLNE